MTRKIILIIATFALFIIKPLPTQAADAMAITDFHADLTINLDGSLDARERIAVEFYENRHGIIRNIPVQYHLDDQYDAEVTLTINSITDEAGQAIPYTQSRDESDLILKIGDANRYVSGEQVYVIDYTVFGAFLYLSDRDELYWNVTGTENEVEIARASATVFLPSEVDYIESACYTGEQGSTAQDCTIGLEGEQVEASAADSLTIGVGFTPGVIAHVEPTLLDLEALRAEQAAEEARLNALFAEEAARRAHVRELTSWLYALVPLAIAGLLWRYRSRVNGHKFRGSIIAEYNAPDDLRPAEVAAIARGQVSGIDYAATIVDFAVRGYLTIEEKDNKGVLGKTQYQLKKKKATDKQMVDWEQDLLITMFASAKSVDLAKLKTRLSVKRRAIDKKIQDRLKEAGYLKEDFRRAAVRLRSAGWIFLFIGGMVPGYFFLEYSAVWPIVWHVIAFLMFYLAAAKLSSLTPKGAEVERQIRGFKLFLKTAERYRLEWQERENIFEELLPYAIALGVAKKWSRVLEIQAQETGQAMSAPLWYRTSRGARFSALAFAESLQSFSSATARAAMPPQANYSGSGRSMPGGGFSGGSSSSSGGGGFSGGGFGGGGTSSW